LLTNAAASKSARRFPVEGKKIGSTNCGSGFLTATSSRHLLFLLASAIYVSTDPANGIAGDRYDPLSALVDRLKTKSPTDRCTDRWQGCSGVNPQHITEWKKGRSKPSGENALAMLELVKTKPKGRKSTR
jgi:hypothetical protein